MLMLSLNNKYFIGSVYAGMLWSLGDVTEPFHVNFFDVLKKRYIDYFYAGFCRRGAGQNMNVAGGVGPDKIYFCGAGGCGTESCGSGREHRSLLQWLWIRSRDTQQITHLSIVTGTPAEQTHNLSSTTHQSIIN